MEPLALRDKLINLRNIFIDEKDWIEVSKIQYDIDNIVIPKPEPVLETWFKVEFSKFLLEMMLLRLDEIINMDVDEKMED